MKPLQRRLRLSVLTVAVAFFSLCPSVATGWTVPQDIPSSFQRQPKPSLVTRRTAIATASAAISTISAWALSDPASRTARAADDTTSTSTSLYTRQLSSTKPSTVSYQVELPTSMKESSKPVKTHLDEVNFSSETIKGYQYGVTVDPVRISSIQEVRQNPSFCSCAT